MTRAFVGKWGLQAHPLVQSFLGGEPKVVDRIKGFILDQTGDMVVVAGPPDPREAKAHKARFGSLEGVPLPSVRLKLRKVRHQLTGEPGVEVAVSDGDLAKLLQWERMKRGVRLDG